MSQKYLNGIGSIELPKQSNGAVAVNIQNQNKVIISSHFHALSAIFTIVSDVTIGDTSFTAVTGHGITAGDMIYFKENQRRSEFTCLNVATDVITLDGPFDYAYTTDSESRLATTEMAVSGTLTSPVVFHTRPPLGVVWDIEKITLSISDNTAMDDVKFGGIAALTNGVWLRQTNGEYFNIFNVKSNSDISEHFDAPMEYSSKAPAGFYGLRAERSLKHGIKLDGDTDDELQILIQDDLTGLEHFQLLARGSVKEA